MSWIIISVIVFLTLSYMVISVLFPEWVGMTGKKALENIKHQQAETEPTPETSTHSGPDSSRPKS